MPRQPEQLLIESIRNGEPYSAYNFTYDPQAREVAFYGRSILRLLDDPAVPIEASLAGHNTPRTRQAINAIAKAWVGRSVLSCVNLRPLVDGQPVNPWAWFVVTKESPHKAG